eukprot:1155061-Pelagomonas_calceolata.AAC.1
MGDRGVAIGGAIGFHLLGHRGLPAVWSEVSQKGRGAHFIDTSHDNWLTNQHWAGESGEAWRRRSPHRVSCGNAQM